MFNIGNSPIPRHNGLGSSGYPETSDILPFVTTFQPTLTGTLLVRQLLEGILPSELAIPIVSLGYSAWTVRRKFEDLDWSVGDGLNESVAGLYLATEPIPYPDPSIGIDKVVPKRIIFQTRSADEGVGLGPNQTTNEIDSWFEASILRPLSGNLEGDDLELADSHARFPNGFTSVSLWTEYLKEKGWEFEKTDDGKLSWWVCNNITEQCKFRDYKVEWSTEDETKMKRIRGVEKGKGEGFLEKLKPGSMVVLWARAEQQDSFNYVAAATIEIEFEVP